MTCQCCEGCVPCTGPNCCGAEFPRFVGFCCEVVWRLPNEGTCCDGVWYTGAGECCGGVWHTDEGSCCGGVWHTDPGNCCGDSWFPAPEGESPPSPPTWFVWSTDQCPEGLVFARWGFSPVFGTFTGQCCGCIPPTIFDPSAGDPPGSGGMVPTESVIDKLCCDPCEPTPYLRTSPEAGNECLGVCCAGDECSRLPPSQCNTWSHPTSPGLPETHYHWKVGCCDSDACLTECCFEEELLEQATFEVAGDPEGSGEWRLTLPGCDTGSEYEYFSELGGPGETLEGIAQGFRDSVAFRSSGGPPSGCHKLRVPGVSSNPWPIPGSVPGSQTTGSVTVVGPNVSSGTISYCQDGDCVTSGPVSTSSKIPITLCQLMNSGSVPTPVSGPCPCRPNGRCLCEPGETCCETATSSGAGLTFSKPEGLAGTVRVTVTGTTTSPILVHGTLKGPDATPTNRCRFSHTFLLCYGTFNIEPVPCGSTFHGLVVEVCYEGHETSTESFAFSGCDDITVYLGECGENCVTTMTYSGAGATSNASVLLTGNGVIEANGAGPLILTGNGGFFGDIRPVSPCAEWLTLTGDSTAANEVSGVIADLGLGVPFGIRKTGPGTWWLTGNNRYTGGLRILDGTVIVSEVPDGFSWGPLGVEWAGARVGDPAATSGTAALLATAEFAGNALIEQTGGSQSAVLGGYGSGSPRYNFFAQIFLGGDVTLQASTGGTVQFEHYWLDTDGNLGTVGKATPAVNFTIGSSGNEGTVILAPYAWLPAPTLSVHVRYGALRLDFDAIWEETPVTLGDAGTSVAMIINGVDQPLSDLTFQGAGSDITGPSGGILRLVDSPTVTIANTGHEISAAVALDDDATFDGTGSLLISGVVSGASGVTMDGSGTISLSGANTYTGTTTINSGTMKAQSLTAFGTGDIVVNAGGTLDKNGYAITNTITNNGGTVIN